MSKKGKLKESDVSDFLKKTGFILEMEAGEVLRKNEWDVKLSTTFLDLNTSKNREIDIIAKKTINKIEVNLVIECKQSLQNNWIFICTQDRPSIYYFSVKHLPKVSPNLIHKNKIFSVTHYFKREIKMAQNFITIDIHKKKKVDDPQIYKCIEKLPKAVINEASKASDTDTKRYLYLPIALFSGQIFTASYKDGLVVKDSDIIQYSFLFENESYRRKKGEKKSDLFMALSEESFSREEFVIKEKTDKIYDTNYTLEKYYTIDFVNFDNFKKYIDIIDKEVNSISLGKWAFKERIPKPPKPPMPK